MISNRLSVLWEDILVCVIFLTRIPVSKFNIERDVSQLTKAQWGFPLIGALLGLVIVFVANIFLFFGFNDVVSVIAGFIAGLLLVKTFYEEGLVNWLDSHRETQGNGQSFEGMKVNTLGIYGTFGLVIATLLKILLISGLLYSPSSFLLIMAAFALGRSSFVILRKISSLDGIDTPTPAVQKASAIQTFLALFFGVIWLVPVSLSIAILTIFILFLLIISLNAFATRKARVVSYNFLGASVQLVEILLLAMMNILFVNS